MTGNEQRVIFENKNESNPSQNFPCFTLFDMLYCLKIIKN